jgi:hypothetical protein
MAMKKQTEWVFIVGRPRSGMTLTAQTVEGLGYEFIGDEQELATMRGRHPAGRSLVPAALHISLLQMAAADGTAAARVRQLLAVRRGWRWGSKDLAFLPVLHELLPCLPGDIKIVECLRDADDARASINAMRPSYPLSESDIKRNWLDRIDVLRWCYPWLALRWEEHYAPRVFGQRIAEFLGVPFRPEAVRHILPGYSRFTGKGVPESDDLTEYCPCAAKEP